MSNENIKKGGISVDTEHIFPIIKKWLYSEKDIFLREIVSNASDAITKLRRLESLGVREATDDDFATEFLDYAISVKTVASVDEAIEHISKYSTKHSECIVTEDKEAAELFTACIDAAAVYVNASTRFTDGFEFGFGAEIGISTQKLHARGPMGLRELTSYKYVIKGNGQIR